MTSTQLLKALALPLFAGLLFAGFPPPVSPAEYVKGSAEKLFWQPPATLHDFKNPSDLHNRFTALFALTELEFVRLGDMLAAFVVQRPVRPLERGLDSLGDAYGRLPQIRPVRRLGELVDAIQIPEFSLSDARGLILFSAGSSGGIVGPIMQVRIYKILVWVEDVIYDVDDVVMLPVNSIAENVRGKETDIRFIGYAGSALGILRQRLFSGIRVINRSIIRFSSNMLRKAESAGDFIIRKRRTTQNRRYPIYARFPYRVFSAHAADFEKTGFFLAGTRRHWNEELKAGITVTDFLKDRTSERLRLSEALPDEAVLFVTEIQFWNQAPADLMPYVITREEFQQFLAAPAS